ncbi:hypothetical protein [Pseudohoeflea coraliihabitans]|uniref:Uncharacterized protein n=1 Tax=Pseudohoeflea coraliihabitans TaxID=2860393 RepID=A0ABS6WT94_9HYPH|nr:hypothetical protein [Pseudohoeflea sp. DP4N28-3]MBW3099187.1 hypothetical protein [Pseudohoeflea sp. DP4N28-3]
MTPMSRPKTPTHGQTLWSGGAVIGWDKPALQFSLYPFLAGAAFKIASAAAVLPRVWRIVGDPRNPSAKGSK